MNAGIQTGCVLVVALAAVGSAQAEVAAEAITITPVSPNNAFVFSPETDVTVQFKVASKVGQALSATLSSTTSAGKQAGDPVEQKTGAKGEATVTFRLGKLAPDFYRMSLSISAGGKALRQSSFPLAVLEKQEHEYKPPLLPVGVCVNGSRHLGGRSAVYVNTYAHAMAQNIKANHFNTVVLDSLFGPEQIAIFRQYGLSVVVQTPSEELLGLESVIGGVIAEDPQAEEVASVMEKQKALAANTEKPLLICVSGDLAGTKSPHSPMRIWAKVWEALKQDAASLEEIEPHVRRYWHYYPIEYGPPHPILQSYAYRGCLSFMDSLQQAASSLYYLPSLKREAEEEETEEGEEKEKDKEKKPKKEEEKQYVYEYFGQIPVWAKLQAFGTTRAQSVYKVPTPAQLQTMMHLALAYQAKGIMLNCYQTDEPGHSGLVDPVTLRPTDGRLAAAGQVAKLASTHAELLAQARYGGGSAIYTNAFAAPIPFCTGTKEEDNLVTYLYVINLNTRAPMSTWLYGLPRVLRDITTGEELKTEMYETRESSWWGLLMTLKPGEARILEKVDLLPTVHQ